MATYCQLVWCILTITTSLVMKNNADYRNIFKAVSQAKFVKFYNKQNYSKHVSKYLQFFHSHNFVRKFVNSKHYNNTAITKEKKLSVPIGMYSDFAVNNQIKPFQQNNKENLQCKYLYG